jgi:hypothetical protein
MSSTKITISLLVMTTPVQVSKVIRYVWAPRIRKGCSQTECPLLNASNSTLCINCASLCRMLMFIYSAQTQTEWKETQHIHYRLVRKSVGQPTHRELSSSTRRNCRHCNAVRNKKPGYDKGCLNSVVGCFLNNSVLYIWLRKSTLKLQAECSFPLLHPVNLLADSQHS